MSAYYYSALYFNQLKLLCMDIKTENLSKCYGEQAAVNDITFQVKTGEILGFPGPNGAGKSGFRGLTFLPGPL